MRKRAGEEGQIREGWQLCNGGDEDDLLMELLKNFGEVFKMNI